MQQEQGEIIRIEDLTVTYNGQMILDHVSFRVAAGEVFVILGGSGSGKSTLLKHLIGLYKPARSSSMEKISLPLKVRIDSPF